MEKKLRMLFEYQRFEKNEKLAELIDEAEANLASELSDFELAGVYAAGEYELNTQQNPNRESENSGEKKV